MTIPAEYRQAHLTLGCQWGLPRRTGRYMPEYCLKHDRDMTPNGCPVAVKAAQEIGADALNRAAEEMGFVIAEGDCAEVAEMDAGEVGRSVVIGRRDALYEDPETWLRARAEQLRTGEDDE